MKKNIFIFLWLCTGLYALGAKLPTLTEKAQISVLTCSSGDVLYTAFGHTAFRVQDTSLGIDVVYNYGTFDFDQPNFYLNFAKGKLIYSLSRRSFEGFLYGYELEKRWVKEQLLNLSQQETNALFALFEKDYRPENRDYAYDPLFNNCSTITGDILKDRLGSDVVFHDTHLKQLYTFRQLVHQYIDSNTWGAFGIDLAFGGITDKTATLRQHMFLPYYAMDQLDNASIKGEPLVLRERSILDYADIRYRSHFLTTPLFWFLAVLLFVSVITYIDIKHNSRSRWLDFALFFSSGMAGLIVMLLWFATNHKVTELNFNFLWLLPLNLLVSFALLRAKEQPVWLGIYVKMALGLMVMAIIIWIIGIQIISPLNIVLMLVLATRYLFLLKMAKA
ncbi:DUF4105 domain-containing protein [Croceitalea dokdonensis]|nr:DUF4105 domain-containing protein [Croceitalea dokdonensis]